VPDLEAVHTPEHVSRVHDLASGGGGWVDADTYSTPASYDVALRAAGATVAATNAVCAGDAAIGYALVRPPGHHACADAAMGFCLFNNVAVAIGAARRHHGVSRVAVIDIDVHHGNGTEAIFASDPAVLYTSLHQWPFYPGTGGRTDAETTNVNVPLPAGTDGQRWLEALRRTILPAVTEHQPELIVVSAGFDAHERDPLGGLRVSTDDFGAAATDIAALAADACDGRTVWALEGGYDADALEESVPLTMRSLLGVGR